MHKISFLLVLFGCGGASSHTETHSVVISDCSGSLTVLLDFGTSEVPSKVRATMNSQEDGNSYFDTSSDDCATLSPPRYSIILERSDKRLRISDGGLGYTAPQ